MASRRTGKPAAGQGKSGVDQRALAAALRLTARQVRNLTDEGVLRRFADTSGKLVYDLAEAIEAYHAHKAAKATKDADGTKGKAARLNLRKLEIEVGREELELAKEREQLVTIDYMEAQNAALLNALRSKILNFPGRYARELAEVTTVADVVEILEGGVAELLTALAAAGDDEALDEADEPPADATEDDTDDDE